MTDRQQIIDKLEVLRKNLPLVKKQTPSIDDSYVSAIISGIQPTDDVATLQIILADPRMYAAFVAMETPQGAARTYSTLGVSSASLPTAPGTSAGPVDMAAMATKLAAATAKGDQAEIARLTSEMAAGAKDPNGQWNPAMIAGIVGIASKFLFGSDLGESAKYSALAALATMGWNWYNSPNGQSTVAGITGGASEGAGNLMDGIGKLFSGGAEGLGGIMNTLGDAAGSLTGNSKLSGLLDTVLGFVKDQPLVAAAVGYGLYAMFGNGFSLGGIFSGMSTAMLAMAVAWIAESVLDLDGPGRNNEIIRDIPGALPSRGSDSHSPAALPIPAVPGDMQVLP